MSTKKQHKQQRQKQNNANAAHATQMYTGQRQKQQTQKKNKAAQKAQKDKAAHHVQSWLVDLKGQGGQDPRRLTSHFLAKAVSCRLFGPFSVNEKAFVLFSCRGDNLR